MKLIGVDEETKVVREHPITLSNIRLEGNTIGILNVINKRNVFDANGDKSQTTISIDKVNEVVAVGNGLAVKDYYVGELVIIKNDRLDTSNSIIVDSLSDETKDVIVIVVDYFNIIGKIVKEVIE
jgi:hypothetical protein